MSITNLLNLLLKLLGLFFVKDILALFPQFLWLLSYEWQNNLSMEMVWPLSINAFTLFTYAAAGYFLIWKTDFVISKMNLDKGFEDETIAFNVHRSTVLSIAVIVIGGLMLANEIPNLCRQLFVLQQENKFGEPSTDNNFFLVTVGVKILLGILLIVYQREIVNLIELKRKK